MTLLQLTIVGAVLAASAALLLWLKRRFPPEVPNSNLEPASGRGIPLSIISPHILCCRSRCIRGLLAAGSIVHDDRA